MEYNFAYIYIYSIYNIYILYIKSETFPRKHVIRIPEPKQTYDSPGVDCHWKGGTSQLDPVVRITPIYKP